MFMGSIILLGVLLATVRSERIGSPRRHDQQVNCPDDVYHCDNPSDTTIIYCDPTTCRWQTDSLDPNNMPSECVGVTKDEMPANAVPDNLEPCYLWETMYGDMYTNTPSPTVVSKNTPSPTISVKPTPNPTPPETDSPSDSVTNPPSLPLSHPPSSAPTIPPSTEAPSPQPSNQPTELPTSQPSELSRADPTPTESVTAENQESTTGDDYLIEIDPLLLGYLVSPSIDRLRRLEVELPWDIILEATRQYINYTLAAVWPVSSIDIEIQLAQSVAWPDRSQLLTAAIWGNVSLPPQVIRSNETGKEYSAWKTYVESTVRDMVDEAFSDDTTGRYVHYLHERSDQAEILSRVESVEYNLLPAEAAARIESSSNSTTTNESSPSKFQWNNDSGPWWTQTLYLAAMAGGTCLLLAVVIIVCTLCRQRRRRRHYDLQQLKVDTTETGAPDDVSSIGGDNSPEKSSKVPQNSSRRMQNRSTKEMKNSSKSIARQSSAKQQQIKSGSMTRAARSNRELKSVNNVNNKSAASLAQSQQSRVVAVNGKSKNRIETLSKKGSQANARTSTSIAREGSNKNEKQSPTASVGPKPDQEELQRIKETYAGTSPKVKVGDSPMLSGSVGSRAGEFTASRGPGSVDGSELTADDQSVQSRSTIMSLVFELTAVNKQENVANNNTNEQNAPENVFVFGDDDSDDETSFKSISQPPPNVALEPPSPSPGNNEGRPPTELVNADDAGSHCVSDNSVLTFDDENQTDWRSTRLLLPHDNNDDTEEDILIGATSMGVASTGKKEGAPEPLEQQEVTRKSSKALLDKNAEDQSSERSLSTATKGSSFMQRMLPRQAKRASQKLEERNGASVASQEQSRSVSGSLASEVEKSAPKEHTQVDSASLYSAEGGTAASEHNSIMCKSAKSMESVKVVASQIMTGVHSATEESVITDSSSNDGMSSCTAESSAGAAVTTQGVNEPAVVSPPSNLKRESSRKKPMGSTRTLLATSKPWNRDVVLSRRESPADNNVDESVLTNEQEDSAATTQSSTEQEDADIVQPDVNPASIQTAGPLHTQEPTCAVVSDDDSDDEDDRDDPSIAIPAQYSKYGITPDGARDDLSVCTWDSSVALATGRRASF